jgi:uncharacterized protein YeaO (DUF488 family)
MFIIKHLMDRIEPEDGLRIWIEPVGLTRDLREWCQVHEIIAALAPQRNLWNWFQIHPDGYDYFRGMYHVCLGRGLTRRVAEELAGLGAERNVTLLHQSDDPAHNSATALYEFLSELQAYCPPEQ